MKYTVNIIDTEEKFKAKFGVDPPWIISTPHLDRKKPSATKTKDEARSKRKLDRKT